MQREPPGIEASPLQKGLGFRVICMCIYIYIYTYIYIYRSYIKSIVSYIGT